MVKLRYSLKSIFQRHVKPKTNIKCGKKEQKEKEKFYLLLSLWSAGHQACQSARGMVNTGRFHLSGGQPQRQYSLKAWPD